MGNIKSGICYLYVGVIRSQFQITERVASSVTHSGARFIIISGEKSERDQLYVTDDERVAA